MRSGSSLVISGRPKAKSLRECDDELGARRQMIGNMVLRGSSRQGRTYLDGANCLPYCGFAVQARRYDVRRLGCCGSVLRRTAFDSCAFWHALQHNVAMMRNPDRYCRRLMEPMDGDWQVLGQKTGGCSAILPIWTKADIRRAISLP